MQQYLPFTVLKQRNFRPVVHLARGVATVLTVYGIETCPTVLIRTKNISVATVLTVYGIETCISASNCAVLDVVATVLTVYGIETRPLLRLQQQESLVATVLTVYGIETLKIRHLLIDVTLSCNSTYRLRY